jgi:hypothetical protein
MELSIASLITLTSLFGSNAAPTKLDMARSPGKPLPNALLDRSKIGFTVPVRDWLLQMAANSNPERGLRGWAGVVYDSHKCKI